jgi:aryl-alcohol dehydrogenase-like predicted oxidoreductase
MTLLKERGLGSGPQVSELCLGTMMFGDQTGAAEAQAMVARFAEAGGTFIDTADSYAGGESERITGRAIAAARSRWFLATRVGNPVAGRTGTGGLSARWIALALDASLDRLETGRIDLYYLHRDDEVTPLEDTLGAIGQALADGRIGGSGFSNFRLWNSVVAQLCLPRIHIVNPSEGTRLPSNLLW